MSKRVADVLIETLQAAGVERCYGIVGDTLNQIAHAIDRSAIQWVHMRHEETGAFAAGAEAQLTGRLTACAGSCGPGSLHFINGLYEANRNRAPVILMKERRRSPRGSAGPTMATVVRAVETAEERNGAPPSTAALNPCQTFVQGSLTAF
jgi:thiamine pyrophosphate-dependent acetolactate synthase large subunit-like protein